MLRNDGGVKAKRQEEMQVALCFAMTGRVRQIDLYYFRAELCLRMTIKQAIS
jgi:hypothetical protein